MTLVGQKLGYLYFACQVQKEEDIEEALFGQEPLIPGATADDRQTLMFLKSGNAGERDDPTNLHLYDTPPTITVFVPYVVRVRFDSGMSYVRSIASIFADVAVDGEASEHSCAAFDEEGTKASRMIAEALELRSWLVDMSEYHPWFIQGRNPLLHFGLGVEPATKALYLTVKALERMLRDPPDIGSVFEERDELLDMVYRGLCSPHLQVADVADYDTLVAEAGLLGSQPLGHGREIGTPLNSWGRPTGVIERAEAEERRVVLQEHADLVLLFHGRRKRLLSDTRLLGLRALAKACFCSVPQSRYPQQPVIYDLIQSGLSDERLALQRLNTRATIQPIQVAGLEMCFGAEWHSACQSHGASKRALAHQQLRAIVDDLTEFSRCEKNPGEQLNTLQWRAMWAVALERKIRILKKESTTQQYCAYLKLQRSGSTAIPYALVDIITDMSLPPQLPWPGQRQFDVRKYIYVVAEGALREAVGILEGKVKLYEGYRPTLLGIARRLSTDLEQEFVLQLARGAARTFDSGA